MNLPQIYDIFNEKWERFQTCWIISDLHFNDINKKLYTPSYPTPNEIISIINQYVGKNDVLIILGDIGDLNYIKYLKGYKILIMGNHDIGKNKYKRIINSYKFDTEQYTKEQAIDIVHLLNLDSTINISKEYDVCHAPYEYWRVLSDNKLFDEVYSGILSLGPKIILSHEPINISFAHNFHGHIHDENYQNDIFHTCLCAEKLNFIPLNLNQWIKNSGILGSIKSIHKQIIDQRKRDI